MFPVRQRPQVRGGHGGHGGHDVRECGGERAELPRLQPDIIAPRGDAPEAVKLGLVDHRSPTGSSAALRAAISITGQRSDTRASLGGPWWPR